MAAEDRRRYSTSCYHTAKTIVLYLPLSSFIFLYLPLSSFIFFYLLNVFYEKTVFYDSLCDGLDGRMHE